MAIISAEQFRNKSMSVIQIPGFDEGEMFNIKVRKLSLVGLMSSGKIPNSLMGVVKEAFEGIRNSSSEEENDDFNVLDKAGEIDKFLNIVCREAMIEPKFEEVEDVMNDAQKLAIFQFTQGGVEEAKSFPEVEGDIRHSDDVKNIPSSTE